MPDEREIELDRDLLQRSAAGDREAFVAFMARHQAAVLRFCQALSDRGEDAEDVLQETFLIAWRNCADFRGDGSARSWLMTIARRQVYRGERRRRPVAAGDTANLEKLGIAAGWGTSSPDVAASLDDRIGVRRAFDRLAPADRQVLILRELEGLTNAEAAAILGLEVAALKSRLHRARLRLMAQLQEREDHAG